MGRTGLNEHLPPHFIIMEKKLIEKRIELVNVLEKTFGISNVKAWLIVQLFVEQDKEFIRLLKENRYITYNDGKKMGAAYFREFLDELAGDL